MVYKPCRLGFFDIHREGCDNSGEDCLNCAGHVLNLSWLVYRHSCTKRKKKRSEVLLPLPFHLPPLICDICCDGPNKVHIDTEMATSLDSCGYKLATSCAHPAPSCCLEHPCSFVHLLRE